MRFSIFEQSPALPGSFTIEAISGRCLYVLRLRCTADSPQPESFRHWTLDIDPHELADWITGVLAAYRIASDMGHTPGKSG